MLFYIEEKAYNCKYKDESAYIRRIVIEDGVITIRLMTKIMNRNK